MKDIDSIDLPRIEFLDCSMHACTMEDTVSTVIQRIENSIFTQHVVVNVAKLVNMRSDTSLKESVNSCDIINIDGMGVVWGARLCGYQVPERVAGIDLFLQLVAEASSRGISVFLLGAKEEVVSETARRLKINHPDLVLAGYHHGYFWDYERKIVNKINNSKADMLFVAISSPRKENFINKWKDELGVSFVMGVGGSFDVVAGKTKRAPVVVQKCGGEWLYRIWQEPRRMWKRYFVTNCEYSFILLKKFISSLKSKINNSKNTK